MAGGCSSSSRCRSISIGALLTAFSWDLWSFIVFRMITGAGIGGEYAAINSAIDELVPARLRGRIALYINGSYWVGAALGALSTLVFLNPNLFAVDLGWRVGFFVGALLSLFILLVRRHVPESLRWEITHGRHAEAEATMEEIERRVAAECGPLPAPDEADAITLHPRRHFGFGLILRAALGEYRQRAMLGLALMISQAFLYNAIFFTYALVLTQFYAVPSGARPGFICCLSRWGISSGVLLLGHYFDTIGRRQMIAATYIASALLLLVTGWLFAQDALTAVTLTLMWTLIFFVASPAASAAYLTVSEIFPLETRALAIAFFYSVGTGVGGVAAPWLFGTLIGTGSRINVFYGYVFAAALMIGAAVDRTGLRRRGGAEILGTRGASTVGGGLASRAVFRSLSYRAARVPALASSPPCPSRRAPMLVEYTGPHHGREASREDGRPRQPLSVRNQQPLDHRRLRGAPTSRATPTIPQAEYGADDREQADLPEARSATSSRATNSSTTTARIISKTTSRSANAKSACRRAAARGCRPPGRSARKRRTVRRTAAASRS